jgi:hypothetical protein
MPHFSKHLDVKQGFNFDKDKQEKVGYILSMKIGDKELTADLTTVVDPEKPTDKLSGVVAVLSSYDWNTGTTDAMAFSGQISTANRQTLAQMLLGSWTDIQVTFKYVIYEYDPLQKKFFKASFVDEALKGLVEKSGSELNVDVADDPSHEVQSPQNYAFRIGIKPQATEQTVNLAVGVSKNVTKKWGITEKAA